MKSIIAIILFLALVNATTRDLFEIREIKEDTVGKQGMSMKEIDEEVSPVQKEKKVEQPVVTPIGPIVPVQPAEPIVPADETQNDEKSQSVDNSQQQNEVTTDVQEADEIPDLTVDNPTKPTNIGDHGREHRRHEKKHHKHKSRNHRKQEKVEVVDEDKPMTGQVFGDDEEKQFGWILLGIIGLAIFISFFVKRCIKVKEVREPMITVAAPQHFVQMHQPYPQSMYGQYPQTYYYQGNHHVVY